MTSPGPGHQRSWARCRRLRGGRGREPAADRVEGVDDAEHAGGKDEARRKAAESVHLPRETPDEVGLPLIFRLRTMKLLGCGGGLPRFIRSWLSP